MEKYEKEVKGSINYRRLELLVSHTLIEQDRYGYEIVKHFDDRTDGEFMLKEATLYSVLKRLEKAGFVEAYWGDETHGGRRKYYALTASGRDNYHQMLQDWQHAKAINEKLLQ